jgi:diguanylate cyclase (GGDEF)-like protein/PAS domain S-box-containing protein
VAEKKQLLGLLLVMLGVFGLLYVRYSWTSTNQAASDNALTIARTAEASFSKEAISSLENLSPVDSEAFQYEQLRSTLQNLVSINQTIRYAYIYVQKDGKLYFTADSEPLDSKDCFLPGQAFIEADKVYLEPFEDGKPIITPPKANRRGTWVSVLVPMKDVATNQVKAVLAMDYPDKNWNNTVLYPTMQAGSIVLTLFLLILALLRILIKTEVVEEERRKLVLANEEIVKAKTTYQDMFEKSQAIMILVEVESGKIINANKAACEFYSYTIEQLKSMNISEINPLKRPEILRKMASAKTRKCPYFEFRHRLASGEFRDVEVFSSPLRIDGHIYLYSIINDITQRKTLEKTILQAHENFKIFFNSIDDLLFVVDKQGIIKHVNSTVCERLGYSEAELIGKPVLLVHPENRREEMANFVMDWLSGKVDYCPIPAITKQGQEIPVELRITAGEWNGEAVTFGVMKDMSEITKSEEKFSKAFNSASVLMAITTRDEGRYLNVNDMFLKTLRYNQEDVIGKRPSDLNLYVDRERSATADGVQNLEVSLRGRDGSVYTGIYSAESIMIGETPCLLKSLTDITKRKEVEEKLIESEQKYKLLFNAMNDAFSHYGVIYDELGEPIDFRIITTNPSFETIIGLKSEAIIGKTASELFASVDQSLLELCGKVVLTGEPVHFNYFSKIMNRHFEVKAYSLSPQEFATIFMDITERIENEKNLEYLNYHDVLTGLYNRRFYEEELRRLNAERNLPISIIYGDVNGLKLVNDAFGHLKGDELLQKAAQAIRSVCREDDIIARLGGDEFVILLPQTNTEAVELIVKRIRETYSKEYVNSISGSISFGWDTKYSMNEDILKTLKNAEDLMYKNKTLESEKIRLNTIKMLMVTRNEQYPGTKEHAQRVSEVCQDIGRAIGLPEWEVCRVGTAGFFCDIGNVPIEEGILNKPGKLMNQEWEEIKRHSEIGFRILCSSHEMSELADYVLTHHERWDGTGYPKGLKGNDIPIGARIIALASSYVAMTSERPYRPALREEVALQEILKNAGTQFDPQIAKAFVENYSTNPGRGLHYGGV